MIDGMDIFKKKSHINVKQSWNIQQLKPGKVSIFLRKIPPLTNFFPKFFKIFKFFSIN